MGKNVVREDVVKISYEVDDKGLDSLSKKLDTLGSGAAESVSKADSQLSKLGKEAQSVSQQVDGAGKKAKESLGGVAPAAQKAAEGLSSAAPAAQKVKDGLNGIAPASQKAAGGVKSLTSDVQTLSSKCESVSKHLQSFSKGVNGLGTKMTLGVTTPILGAAAAAINVGNDFEAEMSRVKAISGATGNQFQKLSQQAMDLGAKTAFSSSEAANGMENLASAGFSTSEIMEAMPGMLDLAASSGEDLANSADIAASTLRGFGLAANQAGHVADVLAKNAADTNAAVADTGLAMKYIAPVAQSAGWSLESVTAAIGLMSNAGIKGEQAGTTLRGALTNLMNPSDVAAKSMKSVGFSAYDAQGKMKPLSQIVGELSSKTANLSNKQRDQVIATIMGTESLSGMQVLLKDGKGNLDQMTESLKNSNGAADEMARTMQDNTKSSIEQMTGSLETAGITVQKALAPSIRDAADKVTELANAFGELDSESQKNILKTVGVVAAIGPVLKAISTPISGISKIVGAIGKSAAKKSAAKAIADTAAAAAPAAKKVGLLSKAGSALSGVFAAIPLPAKIALGVGTAAAVGIGLAIKHAHDEAVKADLAKRFGDVTLSAKECEDAAKQLASTPWTVKLNGVSEAKSQIDGFKDSVKTAMEEMRKTEWKVNMGLKLSDDDKTSFQQSADNLAENSLKYLEQKHYTANLAIDAIMMPGTTDYSKLTTLTDGFYSSQQSQIQKMGDNLKTAVSDALKDGVVSVDESGGIQALQTSIQGIVDKASNEEYTAKLKALSVTASAGGLTADSFQNFTKEMGNQTTDALSKADDSLKVVISELDMQLADGAITKNDYNNLVKSAQSSLNQRKADLQMKNYDITLEPLKSKYKDELSSANNALDSGLSTDFLGGIIPGSSIVKSAYSGISSEARDGLKKMVESAKPQTDEMEKTKQAWIDEGRVPPTAFMQSMQKTYELQAASGDITHQFDLLAGKINSSSATRKVYESMAKAGEEIPKELSDALKNEYGLVYEAGKGLIQKVKPEPTQLDSVKKMLKETGFEIPDTLAKAINDKGTDVAYQVKDLLGTLQEGYSLDSNQIVSLYTDLGMSIPKALADGLAKQEPSVQREVTKILSDLEGGKHIDQTNVETFFKGMNKDIPDAISKQLGGIKDSSVQKSLMTSFSNMLGGQKLEKSQVQSLFKGMNLGGFSGLAQGISKVDANAQMQVVKELTAMEQGVKLKSEDLQTLFSSLSAKVPKSFSDMIARIKNATDQQTAVDLFGKLYTNAQLGAEELKSLTKYAGISMSDGLILGIATKSPAAQQAAVSLFQSVQNGTQASSSQIKSLTSSVGLSFSDGFISSLAEQKPNVQNQAMQLLTTVGTAADKERPAMIAKLAKVGGEPVKKMLASMKMDITSDNELIYASGNKAGQMVAAMDEKTANAVLKAPGIDKILNSDKRAKEALTLMNGKTGTSTLKGPTMGPIQGAITAAVNSINEVQGYLREHPLTQSLTVQGHVVYDNPLVSGKAGPLYNPTGAFIASPKAAGGLVQQHQLYQVAESNKREMIIPLQTHRERAIGLWKQTGQALGADRSSGSKTSYAAPHTSYTPKYSTSNNRNYDDHSTYAPQFIASFGGNTPSNRDLERAVKKWIAESMQDAMDSRNRRNPAEIAV